VTPSIRDGRLPSPLCRASARHGARTSGRTPIRGRATTESRSQARAARRGKEARPEYWLCHCEGLKVETPLADHVGFVEEVVWCSDYSLVEALVVREGFGGAERLTVPIEQVVSIHPEASLVVAARPAR
jgi:hypothetical protein